MSRIRIWDLPTRLFHWAVVLLIPLQWWTAEEELMVQHRALGYTMLGLLIFRILWGLIGSSTARFAGFVTGPAGVYDYLRGRTTAGLGHNPVGALSVLAMLGALAVQVALGLFASDEDGLETGPLAHFVSYDVAEEIAELHEAWFYVVLGLIGVHLAAILFYLLVKRDNLVAPMISGTRDAPDGAASMVAAPAWRFALAAALAAGLTWWIASGL